jgi:hypothetical protein
MRTRKVGSFAAMALVAALIWGSARAQAPGQAPPKPYSEGQVEQGLSTEPPAIPVAEIIKRFGEREQEMKIEREKFTYQQTFVFQTIDNEGEVDGEYRMSSDMVFLQDGKRYEKITDAPQPTLKRVSMSEEDINDLEHVQPFVLTTDELPKYDIKYVGREQVDELPTYVFDVAPKKIEKKQRYYQGRIWVDQRDLEIVKTYGKAVPDIHKGDYENVFPRFETIRENIEGNYWFPTYTHADDTLHFVLQNIRIRMTVRYKNYKRYGVTVKFGKATEVKPGKPDKP